MRIAQIAPLWERVPPLTYGGTELIASLLTDELVRRGHEVTLFASGDSITLATLEAVHPCALRHDQTIREYGIYEMLHLAQVYERAAEFDIIHSHVGCATLPYVNLVSTPTVHTLHGIFTPDNEKLFSWAKDQPFVSISNDQRDRRLGLNYVATVYNGVDTSSYKFYPTPQTPPYLAFLGRFSPEKGPHHAIEIAKRVGLPLKMAGKIDAVDVDYFERDIRPHIDGVQIQYLGEANHLQKNVLMGNAIATLFPITWREPFGLVMIESMASGTPVIAMPLGSTTEVIAHGKTGFLCDTLDDCVAAVHQIDTISRHDCRDRATRHFGIKQMVDGYEAVYAQLVGEPIAETNHRQLVGTI
ncbi:MAG TPA: glycosyltransferase family 4 protein [Chroococcidiopsis sp.]